MLCMVEGGLVDGRRGRCSTCGDGLGRKTAGALLFGGNGVKTCLL